MNKSTALSRTLSTDWYVDEAIYEKERRGVFGEEWIYLAHESELPEPGDYITTSIAGYQIILLNSNDGIKACHNICRHRGASLLTEPSGKLLSKNMTCRYHAWSYDQEGNLVNAPFIDCKTDCEGSDFSLFKINTNTYQRLIFINLSNKQVELGQKFKQLFQEIESSEFDLSRYVVHSKMERIADFNWKVWVEGYQECGSVAKIS